MNKKRTLELLQKARAVITDPERWTKGEYARDQDGNALITVPEHSLAYPAQIEHLRSKFKEITCFCGMGVLRFEADSFEEFGNAWPTLVQAVVEFKQGSESRSKMVEKYWKKYQKGGGDSQAIFHDFNDHEYTTHAEVLAVYDAAIAIAAKDYADSLPSS